MSPTIRVRPARHDELDDLVVIEREADTRFVELGIDAVVTAGVAAPSDCLPALRAGRLFVAEEPGRGLVGFVRVELVDDEPHVEQVSVRPSASGQGVGRALMEAAERWARLEGHTRITLCTYRDVPWNGPWYARLGWLALPDADQGPQLQGLRRHERELGLETHPRLAMWKPLPAR